MVGVAGVELHDEGAEWLAGLDGAERRHSGESFPVGGHQEQAR